MPKIQIIKSADQQSVRFELVGIPPAIIPCDSGFHIIDGRLLGAVEASDIEVLIETDGEDVTENTGAPDAAAALVEGAEGLGGASAPSTLIEGETPAPIDADGDGHDDNTGEFVPGNKAAKRRRRTKK